MKNNSNFKEIEHNLKKINIHKNKGKYSSLEIDEFEKEHNIRFPSDYKKFVIRYGGQFVDLDIFYKPIERSKWTGMDGYDSIDVFYGIKDDDMNIFEAMSSYLNRIPKSIIPIAECQGGNLLCIGVENYNNDTIYFWDHENELEAKVMLELHEDVDINSYWDNITIVAYSFNNFIKSLEYISSEEE